MNLHLDYETRSTVDLKKCGAHIYAAHPSTEILCAAYAIDDGRVRLWRRGEPADALVDVLESAGTVTAHNAAFEHLITNGAAGRRLDLPSLSIEQMRCTMVMSMALGMPGDLEHAGPAFGLGLRKDAAGHRIMLKLSKPRRPRKGDVGQGPFWHEDPADLEKLYAYCVQDVEVERALEKRLLPLSADELALWFLDQRINDRGVAVDLELAESCKKIVADVARLLDIEMFKTSDGRVRGVTDIRGLMAYGRETGLKDLDSLAKDQLAILLARDDLDPAFQRCLEIRSEGAKTSVAKIDALVRSRGADGRARGFLQFHAANTGRWAGRRFQPQNLKRPETPDGAMADLIATLRTGAWSEVDDLVFGPALGAVGDSVRGMVAAAPGAELTAADYSNIEGRVLAFLAGEAWKLDAFRAYDAGTGPDLYKLAYGRSFSVDVKSVTKQQRQVGKVMELALGYAGGPGAFLAMAKGYGLDVGSYADVIRAGAPEAFKEAEDAWNHRGRASGTKFATWVAAETLKLLWRKAHPAITTFWTDLEDAAELALKRPGDVTRCGPLRFLKKGSWLFLRLPSGRPLAYPYPEMREVPYFGKTKLALTYKTVPDPNKPGKIIPEADGSIDMRWARISTYGGMLAENATQAVARDILAVGMTSLDRAGWPIVLHVHDEVVAEHPKGWGSEEAFCRLMTTLPACYAGLPITAESFRADRYRK